MSRIEVPPPSGSAGSLARIARYVPTEDDLSVYTFDGLESESRPGLGTGSGTPKLRVYEIAKEFGVDSKEVLAKLQSLGEFVRSASSTVEPDALRRLWEHFAAPSLPPRPARPQLPPPATHPAGGA